MSRTGNVWDNSVMESFFSSLKTERIAGKVHRTRDEARADVFDYIERFHNPRRRRSAEPAAAQMAFTSLAGSATRKPPLPHCGKRSLTGHRPSPLTQAVSALVSLLAFA